jgi:hypothetical protein
MAFTRSPAAQSTPRLHEVRTAGELTKHLREHESDFALIEVGPANLTEVLQLLARRGPQAVPFVALLEETADQRRHAASAIPSEPRMQAVADLLWEMGAVEVVASPRQLRGLLALHHRLATARGPVATGFSDRQSVADRAWSSLPWQDS